ncbi:reverse transcriptase domain-containing protein [Tanacetum coccineum]
MYYSAAYRVLGVLQAKWAVELGAYDISYASRSAIKGQGIADILEDTVIEGNPAREGVPDLEEVPESSNIKDTPAASDTMTKPVMWKLYTDGTSNDHGSSAWLILIDPDGAKYSYDLLLNFTNSNNDAKYEALLAWLRIATEMKVNNMHAFVNSKLVASQVEGSYKAKGEKTKKYKEKVLEVVSRFDKFQISHIPREQNKKVDPLSKLVAVQFDHLTKEVLVEVLNERSMDIAEVNMVVEEEGKKWMTSIRD